MKLICTKGPFGDETSLYDVKDYPEKIKDFVEEVLKNKKEWGYITINGTQFEFSYGELKNCIPEQILHKRIVKIFACGGWTRMDYELTVK